MKDLLKEDMAFLRDKFERGLAYDAQDNTKLHRIFDALGAELDKPAPAAPKKTTKKKK